MRRDDGEKNRRKMRMRGKKRRHDDRSRKGWMRTRNKIRSRRMRNVKRKKIR
jgi:hypothetical protein